jgi:hypothetical protein
VITPRLLRRSLRRGFRWRVLLLFWAALLLPSAIATAPAFAFLRQHLDHSPRAPHVVAWMDGETLLDLVRQLGENGASRTIFFGLGAAALGVLAIAPFVAGAMVSSAREGEALSLARLCAGAGGLYGRMLRTNVAGLVPLGVAAAAVAGLAKLAIGAGERALTETAAMRGFTLAAAGAAAVLFIGHLLVDGARAQFAADPDRRSALGALRASVRLLARRPGRTLSIGLLGAAVGLGLPVALMSLRLQIVQAGPVTLALAWSLAQMARVAVGWGRAARIEGLAELTQADIAERERQKLQLNPSPAAQVVHSATLAALEPPRSGAPR